MQVKNRQRTRQKLFTPATMAVFRRTFAPPRRLYRTYLSGPKSMGLVFCVLVICSMIQSGSSQNSYAKKTGEVFEDPNPAGFPAAFWDTNHDRLTDVIVWEEEKDASKVYIYESTNNLQARHPVLRKSDLFVEIKARKIVSVIPGDFNGDMILDLVIVTVETTPSASPATSYRLHVSWGKRVGKQWQLTAEKSFPDETDIDRQPVVIDYDGNTVPDFLVQVKGSIYRLFVLDLHDVAGKELVSKWELVKWEEMSLAGMELAHQSGGYIDIDGDQIADVCLAMKDKNAGNYSLVVAQHKMFQPGTPFTESPFNAPTIIPINPQELKGENFELGQVSFVDFNDDLKIDIMLPLRLKNDTTYFYMFDWPHDTFTDITPDWKGYQLMSAQGEIPHGLHYGDYDQDGFIDGLGVVTKDGKKQVALFRNPSAPGEESSTDLSRKLEMDLPNELALDNVDLVAFFDAYDDGSLDIIVSSQTGQTIDLYQNQLGIDATWIKAMVYSGFCGKVEGPGEDFPPCDEGSSRHELSLPVVGASIKMSTTRGDGNQQQVVAGLLSQFTHFSLQMPTTIFGLGRSPNFVDKIIVGLPPALNYTTGNTHTKTFEQTIPNSAVVISPIPLTEPSQWRAYIYVTPSSAMLETGIVLSVVFALLAILVGLLHLKEKREDQKEKLVEMQRFHFDAM